jgi:hypothetical protein
MLSKTYEIKGNPDTVWAAIEAPGGRGMTLAEIKAALKIRIKQVNTALSSYQTVIVRKILQKQYGSGAGKMCFAVHNEDGQRVYVHLNALTDKQRVEAEMSLRRLIDSITQSGKQVKPAYFKQLSLLQNYLLWREGTNNE